MNNIYVINLEHRKDRMNNINERFKNYFNINRVEAVKDKEGWIGCLKSHKKCIQYAKDNNLKYIIVMEDDCTPKINDWFEKFNDIKENIFEKKDDWDIFLGGSTKTNTKNINKYDFQNVNIYNIIKAHNTHLIVYNHTCYDFFLNSNNELPIDVLWHKKIRCIIPLPFLFTVISSFSDIGNVYTKMHKIIIDNNEKKLIKYIEENNIN